MFFHDFSPQQGTIANRYEKNTLFKTDKTRKILDLVVAVKLIKANLGKPDSVLKFFSKL
jgi:hypothetical protein